MMLFVEPREVDEQLAMLCHLELAGGAESVAEALADMPRAELERLLGLAVAELLDVQHAAEQDLARLARRLQENRAKREH